MDGETPVQPDVTMLSTYRRNPGPASGPWPSSPDITHAMLETPLQTEDVRTGAEDVPNRAGPG
jgi:hypothetical protein